MKKQGALAAFSLIVLSACSNSPSDGDVKKAVIEGLEINNCRNFSIDSFEKVNGMAGSDSRRYRVAVKYTLKIAPLPNAQAVNDQLAAEHEKQDLLLQQAQQKYSEFQDARKIQPQEDVAKNAILDIRLDEEVQKAKTTIKLRGLSDGETLFDRYSEGCATKSGFMLGFISKMYATDKGWIASGVAKEITDTIDLVKTDNGWMQVK